MLLFSVFGSIRVYFKKFIFLFVAVLTIMYLYITF